MTEPTRTELLDLYKVALDEYRFQVTLNWQRTQYYLAFNAAVFAAGTGLAQAGEGRINFLVALVYAVGVASCSAAILAGEVQHRYYREARDAKAQIEMRLELGDLAIRTTPGMGSIAKRFGTVRGYNCSLMVGLAAADAAGIAFALYRLGQH